MVAFMKTRMFSLMGSAYLALRETERVYNTVNVKRIYYHELYLPAKVQTTTLTANVKFKRGTAKSVSITATRYTGTDHHKRLLIIRHSGGKGGSI